MTAHKKFLKNEQFRCFSEKISKKEEECLVKTARFDGKFMLSVEKSNDDSKTLKKERAYKRFSRSDGRRASFHGFP